MSAAAFPYGSAGAQGQEVPGFLPTHVVPPGGLSTWSAPDAVVPTDPLDPLLPVQLLDRRGDWGQVLCSNGWSAWVDARLLVTLPQDPPPAGGALTRTADARRLLQQVQETLEHYRRAVEDLATGRTDGETFGRTTQGLRIGVVVDGDSMWLYDADRDNWGYCDGTSLTGIAGRERSPKPSSMPPAPSVPPEATRLDTGPPGAPPPTRLDDGTGRPPHGPGGER
ncbi:hypothetical protein [Streptomyces sp. NPDC049585]|uniref:hypothetical protein n=1 Tax=Streptomyces sp. NPDC049585 TaxID=3155154 RepID=UPI00342E9999